MGERGRRQPTRGAPWVFNAVPDLESARGAACFRGCVWKHHCCGCGWLPMWLLSRLAASLCLGFLICRAQEIISPRGSPGDWPCWAQGSVKYGTVGFVSSSWLRFGARAVCQGRSFFLSSPLLACDTKAKSRIAFARGIRKATEHPSTPWVTPVGMSHLQAAAISASTSARRCALGHGVERTEVAARGECIMVLHCSKEIAAPGQDQLGCPSALCSWSQEQRGCQGRGVQGSLPDVALELLGFAVRAGASGGAGTRRQRALGTLPAGAGSTHLLWAALTGQLAAPAFSLALS